MITQKRKRGPAPTGKGQLLGVRLHDDILSPLDDFIDLLGGDVSRPEAVRQILRDALHVRDAAAPAATLTADEDAAINAYYASGAPGVGAQFLRAIINHLRSELRSNPEITVEEVKEFVLGLFDNYGQDLEEHIAKTS